VIVDRIRRLIPTALVLAAAGVAQAPKATRPALAREMVAAHNDVRQRIGLKPLAWSEPLARVAQEWANTLIANGDFAHRTKSPYGENLYEIRGGSSSAAEVVSSWADESRDYDYASNRCRSMCGHYTQIVWATTKSVGCAVARGQGREVWVCNYDPPGNYVGERPYGALR